MEKLILSLPYVTFTLPVYSLSVGIMKRTNVQSSPNAATSSPMEMISFLESLKQVLQKIPETCCHGLLVFFKVIAWRTVIHKPFDACFFHCLDQQLMPCQRCTVPIYANTPHNASQPDMAIFIQHSL